MSYKFTYFNAMGRGEVARYMFALSKTKYEDDRVETAKWPALKPSIPYGQLPVLTYNGVQYCQSDAIVRFLARQFKYYGKTELDGLLIDQITGAIEDFYVAYLGVYFLPASAEKDRAHQQLMGEPVAKLLKFLEKNLGKSDWFVGDQVSLADAAVFGILTGPISGQGHGWTATYPSLGAFVKRFGDIPQIKEYIAKRPPSEF